MLPNSEIVYNHDGRLYPLPYSKYPGGEPLVRWSDVEYHKPTTMLLRQRSMDAVWALLTWADAQRERGQPLPDVFIPQFPGARQDRLNDTGDFLFTAKTFAREINARQFPSVRVLDPHSDVVPALLDRCRVVSSAMASNHWRHPSEYRGVLAPDGGAEKRAHKFAQQNGLQLFHAWKSRDVSTGAITGFGTEPLEAGHYLIVDDICDGGGTFIGLADKLKEQNCTADLFVTHGLFTKGTQPLLDRFTKVITTDSTLGDKPGVEIVPVCEWLFGGSYTPDE